jgi:predicted transcriptional regulator of viral defense system
VKSESNPIPAKAYIDRLAANGRYSFTSADARAALGVSADAAKLAINRLSKQGAVAAPGRGFYVIVPPEYRSLGCLPAEQFIPALMDLKGQPYYVGLLSAAQYYGAAHQRPQEFQVFLEKNRRPISCGKVRIRFIARKQARKVQVRNFNTPRGRIHVSTPGATAVDLAGYPQYAGGLSQVATVLSELADELSSEGLAAAAATAPLPWAQRLGYLLEQAGAAHVTAALQEYVHEHAREYTLLMPGASTSKAQRLKDWKLLINADVESDL